MEKQKNKDKYGELVKDLTKKFPNFDFSQIEPDYKYAPSSKKAVKCWVKCSRHGWMHKHLFRMKDTINGCVHCGSESKRLASKTLKVTRSFAQITSGVTSVGNWVIPKEL
jgi:hypothetical protein